MLHFSPTGKDAAACQGWVGHPPLGPLPFPSAYSGLGVHCLKGRVLPAATSSVCKDNTISSEAALDGCAPSLRLMDTYIYSNGRCGLYMASSQVQEASFQTCKRSSTLMRLTEAWKVNVQWQRLCITIHSSSSPKQSHGPFSSLTQINDRETLEGLLEVIWAATFSKAIGRVALVKTCPMYLLPESC